VALSDILSSIDQEIAQLERARAILTGTIPARQKKSGRPKKLSGLVLGSGGQFQHVTSEIKKPAKKKRTLSPEARKKIADAQKKRWAAVKRKTA
jgi:hypothetical protein